SNTLTQVTHVPAGLAAGPLVNAETGKKMRFSGNHLDARLQGPFNNRLIPLTRATMAVHTPWYALSLDERQALFDRVFPDIPHEMSNRVTDWQSKFGVAAVTAIDAKFSNDLFLLTQEARATYCQDALGTHEHGVEAMKAPFMWKRWTDSGKKQGKFRGELILKTFAFAHYPVVQSLPADLHPLVGEGVDARPCGALILSVLAVERALRMWRTGVKTIQPGALGHFSADNWGDKTIIVNGVAKRQEKVKRLMDRARKMEASAWDVFLREARSLYLAHKSARENHAIVIESHSDLSSASSDSDFTAADE
ncbi:hypothetical protein C8Q77DRAFT_1065663, partial [Trametes polyzona]